MRKTIAAVSVVLLGALALAPVAMAQARGGGRGGRALPEGYIAEGIPKMPNPPGPAPKRDISGAWVGPQDRVLGPFPAMTAAGEKMFKLNKPYVGFGDLGGKPIPPSNDPFTICDPLGFPRNLLAHAISWRGGMLFATAPDRLIINYEQQRVWREVWMDGRPLPAKVDAVGAPDSRYYGYSVGHWEDDSTLVIDTTGVDERPWLDEDGHPRSSSAKIQERYKRLDQYNMQLTVTVDDPKFYTKPFQYMKANLYWIKDQTFAETFCIPSEGLQYRESLAKPSGLTVESPN